MRNAAQVLRIFGTDHYLHTVSVGSDILSHVTGAAGSVATLVTSASQDPFASLETDLLPQHCGDSKVTLL